MKSKKGNILTENIVFIILNLVFLSILIIFLISKMGAAAVLEESYAKEIALMIDSAEPGMQIYLDMSDALNKAKDSGWDMNKVVSIRDNIITVKLREKGGYSYSYFNDVDVQVTPDIPRDQYFFAIN